MDKLDAFVFDLDGTLVDSLADIAHAVNGVLQDRGRSGLSAEQFRPLVGWGLRQLVVSVTMDAPFDPDELEEVYKMVLAGYRAHPVIDSKLYLGMSEVLTDLASRVSLSVLSNKEDEVTKSVVKTLLPGVSFRSVHGAKPGVPHKPDPRALLAIVDELGTIPSRVAFLGDSDVDIETALGAGCLALGAGWGFRTPEELVKAGAAEVFLSVSDFHKWVKEKVN